MDGTFLKRCLLSCNGIGSLVGDAVGAKIWPTSSTYQSERHMVLFPLLGNLLPCPIHRKRHDWTASSRQFKNKRNRLQFHCLHFPNQIVSFRPHIFYHYFFVIKLLLDWRLLYYTNNNNKGLWGCLFFWWGATTTILSIIILPPW